jgi:hypothetical protein
MTGAALGGLLRTFCPPFAVISGVIGIVKDRPRYLAIAGTVAGAALLAYVFLR